MNLEIIDKIAWWIPFKNIRSKFRKQMIENNEKKLYIYKEFMNKQEELKDSRFDMKWEDRHLCLNDNTASTGISLYQTLYVTWFSRILSELKPKKHIDIASHFTNVILPISAFVDVDFYDIRPVIPFEMKGLRCIDGNITNLNIVSNSVESISSFSVIEHIGLERYGDPFDPKGDIKAINELIRVTKTGGNIFISLPIASKAIIQYNAHRVYTPNMIIEYFKGCHLKDFKWINENKEIVEDINLVNTEGLYWCEGLFWFIKN
ncbi:DUF268 domain-containing protein [Brachyspira hyodysenteriae]|uniref:DUF268 domain-containing protein n=1 Tax=Brachyspira hyodysenteriae TaxID=159 RepID=UPI0022CD7E1F|nr:DUF268 domain-containing protein [Brachyspira hyodysenteriae]MCZ9918341.1 DUF268 domain-containing protein [Brachyspira hyodysenteriae]